MLIDCNSCTARPRACGDCIVTHLLQVGPVRGRTEDSWPDAWDPAEPDPDTGVDGDGDHDLDVVAREPVGGTELTPSEVAAVAVLSAGGLVPPLRLVTGSPAEAPPRTGAGGPGARRTPRRSGTRAG